MTTLKQITQQANQSDKEHILAASDILFDVLTVKKQELTDIKSLDERIAIIESYINCLNKVLTSRKIEAKAQRFTLIKAIEQLTMQKEDLEILAGKYTLEDLRIASERFGRKAQSSIPY